MDKMLTICGIIKQKQIAKSYFIENFPIVMDVCVRLSVLLTSTLTKSYFIVSDQNWGNQIMNCRKVYHTAAECNAPF